MLNIPIVAIIDDNSNPDDINYPIPGNDDATRSINTFCELITDSIKSGMNNYSLNSGDPGNSEILSEDKAKLDKIESKLDDAKKNIDNNDNNTTNIKDTNTDKGELDL